MLKIGNIDINGKVALAPMAGICDSAFRRIVKSMGCGLIETEMVSSSPAFTEGIVTFTSGDVFSAASTVMFEASAGA